MTTLYCIVQLSATLNSGELNRDIYWLKNYDNFIHRDNGHPAIICDDGEKQWWHEDVHIKDESSN